MEILQTHFSFSFQKNKSKKIDNDIKQRFLCDFGDSPNSLQTRSKLICFHFSVFFLCYLCFLKKRNEFGVSLEILQARSKLICFHFSVFFSILLFLEKRNEFGVSLEILHTLSKLTPNSLQTHMFFCYFIFWGEKLGILQTHSKPAPNSYVFIFSAFTYYIFVART